jgi:hypothetical protein
MELTCSRTCHDEARIPFISEVWYEGEGGRKWNGEMGEIGK